MDNCLLPQEGCRLFRYFRFNVLDSKMCSKMSGFDTSVCAVEQLAPENYSFPPFALAVF